MTVLSKFGVGSFGEHDKNNRITKKVTVYVQLGRLVTFFDLSEMKIQIYDEISRGVIVRANNDFNKNRKVHNFNWNVEK